MLSFPVFTTIEWTLIVASLFTSGITAVMGVGGGVLLMILMLFYYPPLIVIPVHGVVQAGSNAGRAFFLRKHINWTFVGPFMAGGIIGSILGGQVVWNIPKDELQILLGILAIIFCWMPKLKSKFNFPFRLPIIGAIVSFMGMFGGGGGLIFGAFMSRFNLPRQETIATHASCIVMQHLAKIIIFGAFGFAFGPYIPLMTAMIISGLLGSWIGTHLLHKMTNETFHFAFKILITALCFRLIWMGLS